MSVPTSAASRKSLLPFLGLACGVGVSTMYYNQPLLLEMGRTFHLDAGHAGLVAVATQVGYSLGLLFFVPMGDLRERRSLMQRLFGLVSIALVLIAVAPTFPILVIASGLAGALASVTHVALPIAPDLAQKGKSGSAVGTAMAGLLLGVLLARTFAGWINDAALAVMRWSGHAHLFSGWRSVFMLAAVMNAAFVPALRYFFPVLPAKQTMPYTTAMRSLWTVFKEEPLLREAGTTGGLLFAAFSCFWNTLSFLLGRHGLGAGVTGTFGVIGVVGVLMASVAGKQSDRKGPRWVLSFGMAFFAAAFVLMWISESMHLSLALHVVALIVGVIVLDIGQQLSQIANQTRIFSLRAEARSRLNTVYMVMFFTGGATGSALSMVAWAHWQWNGVCALALFLVALAALRHLTGVKTKFVPHKTDHSLDLMLEG